MDVEPVLPEILQSIKALTPLNLEVFRVRQLYAKAAMQIIQF